MNVGNTRTTNNTAVMWIVAAFALLVVGGLIIAEATPLLFPPQGSAESQQIDELFKFMLAIGGAIFLLVQGALVYSIIRFRARPGDWTDGAHIHGNATLELVWTLIPALIVLVLSVYSYQVWINTHTLRGDELVVNSQGARFVWSFSYDIPIGEVPADVVVENLPPNIQEAINNNGSFTVSSKELHTYVGQPVKMALTTADNQHAFWIPAMRIKQDLLAGRETQVRFTPVKAGTYPVVCAELCGGGHGEMRATIIVHESEEAFMTEFVNPQRETIFYPPDDPVAMGELIMTSGSMITGQAYPCSGCHILDALGWVGITGPNLNGVGERAATARATATGSTPEEYLYRSLSHPAEYLVPGFGALMPVFQSGDAAAPNYMPGEDKKAIVAYLCMQTASGESACNLDNLDAIIAAGN